MKERKKSASKRRETNDDFLEGAELVVSPEIKALKAERKKLWRRPSVLQLAHVAALLPHAKRTGKNSPTRTEMAVMLWRDCQRALAKEIDEEIDEEIYHLRLREEYDQMEPDVIPDWEWVLLRGDDAFPMTFEEGVKLIVGENVRLANRHKQFREFTRHVFRTMASSDARLEDLVEQRLARLRKDGFDPIVFRRAAERYDAWRTNRLKQRAKEAARTRWGKAGGDA